MSAVPIGVDRLAGVAPVMMTPFDAAEEVDLASFDRVLEHLLARDVPAIMFPGFASEFAKLAPAEKTMLGIRLIEATRGTRTVPVLAVQAPATRVALDEARTWVDSGAQAVNLLPPRESGAPRSQVVAHCRALLAALPETAVVLQHAPTAPGGLTAGDVRELAAEHPNLVAVKVEARPPYRFIAELAEGDAPIPSLAGNGGLYLLESLRLGAVGVQPGSGFVEVYESIMSVWADGDEATAAGVFGRLVPYLLGWATTQDTMVAAEKRIAHRRGLISTPVCRRPGVVLSDTDAAAVDRFVEEFALVGEVAR
ncbi:dihydrodipicolinate synthase family protein [Agromyces sp. SYSU T0242]|uniref:dihydrodipicolinate synthase family protein n=1 Tax=Agromyces litoreus TaxID=3158561 RepID=UPI0033953474